MASWLIALLAGGGAALLALGARLGAWWSGRAAAREKARLEAEVARTTVERDAAVGEATVAKVQTEALTEHVAAQTAAAAVAREVSDVASKAGPSSADRIAAIDEWVREHERENDKGPVPDPRGAPPVRTR